MVQRLIVLLLLFGAAINIPAALMAAGNGNWTWALFFGVALMMFIASAVVYAALVVSGRNEHDHD